MLRCVRNFIALIATILAAVPLCAQAPDLEALMKIANATDIDTAARYFPPEIQEAVAKLSKEMREEVNLFLPVQDAFKRENLTLQFSPDAGPFILFDDPKGGFINHLEFYIDSHQCENDVCEIKLGIKECSDCEVKNGDLMLRLKYVYPDWRVYEAESLKSSESIRLDDAKLVDKMIEGMLADNEASARRQILDYANSVKLYGAMFPRNGVPQSLAQLGPPEDLAEPGEDHAALLGSELTTAPYERHRYCFIYRRKGAERFTVVARPVKFGISGRQSYYIDETMKIRFTDKDKAPDAHSKLVEAPGQD